MKEFWYQYKYQIISFIEHAAIFAIAAVGTVIGALVLVGGM